MAHGCPLILRWDVVNSFDGTLSVFQVLAVYGSGLNRKHYLDLKGTLVLMERGERGKCESRAFSLWLFFNSHANFSQTFLAY